MACAEWHCFEPGRGLLTVVEMNSSNVMSKPFAPSVGIVVATNLCFLGRKVRPGIFAMWASLCLPETRLSSEVEWSFAGRMSHDNHEA
jgi:hypothetical protein